MVVCFVCYRRERRLRLALEERLVGMQTTLEAEQQANGELAADKASLELELVELRDFRARRMN